MAYEEVPGRLGKWLERFPKDGGKTASVNDLKFFFKANYGAVFKTLRGGDLNPGKKIQLVKEQLILLNDYIERYISEYEERNYTDDLFTMIKWIINNPKSYSYTTAGRVYNEVKKFFSRQPENISDHWYTLSDVDDEDIRRLIPKRGDTLRDDKPTKAQLRSILEHLSIQHKAFVLFAASTGIRPSAIQRVQLEDMDFDADPPFTYLRQKEGGKSVPPRIWFSYEARDAIKTWMKVLPTIKKKTGGQYDPNTPLDVSYSSVWENALKRAGLDEMYEMSRKKQYIYHFYTLRKFFYTNMKNDGMDVDIVNALMGHEAYLAESYDRTGVEKLAEIYLSHMDAVQIYVKEDEFISDQTFIQSEDVDVYNKLGWKWSGHTLPDGRLSMDWNQPGKPRYPVGE